MEDAARAVTIPCRSPRRSASARTLAQRMAMGQSPILVLSQQGLHERMLKEIEENPVVERIEPPETMESLESLRERETAETIATSLPVDNVPSPAPSVAPVAPSPDAPDAAPDGGGPAGDGPDGDSAAPLDFDDGFGSILRADADETDLYFQNGGNNEYSPDAEERRQYRYNSIAAHVSLEEHLVRQLATLDLSPRDEALAMAIVQSLDSRGFLSVPLADIAQSCGTTLDEAARMLARVQELDPTGVAARSLAECFLPQLQTQDLGDVLAADLLRDHPDFFRPRDFRQPSLVPNFQCSGEDVDALASDAGCSRSDILFALNDLRGLLAAPADLFADADGGVILTDATVVERGGRFVVLEWERQRSGADAGDDGVIFRVSDEFRAMAGDPATPAAFRTELRRKIGEAEDLAQKIRGRRSLVVAVAAAIVARQQDFFRLRDLSALRPMVQRDIAADVTAAVIPMDESQVSRACSDKWMKTPMGNLRFGDFFSRSLGGATTRNVKERVRQIISAEDPRSPLSDSAVAKRLADEGVTLSREAVKKYRGEMGIPSSTARKRP